MALEIGLDRLCELATQPVVVAQRLVDLRVARAQGQRLAEQCQRLRIMSARTLAAGHADVGVRAQRRIGQGLAVKRHGLGVRTAGTGDVGHRQSALGQRRVHARRLGAGLARTLERDRIADRLQPRNLHPADAGLGARELRIARQRAPERVERALVAALAARALQFTQAAQVVVIGAGIAGRCQALAKLPVHARQAPDQLVHHFAGQRISARQTTSPASRS